ncbi:MAG: DUF3748 domain-containing protein [Cyclobacteriaceae bacterium]|nr:DUF3748 domain-containing protein [Cyclobacteriaceae bacterium]
MIKIAAFIILISLYMACTHSDKQQNNSLFMTEKQITFSQKNHSLDNNDNFSPDGKFLCYDTRPLLHGIAHCKSIEKVDIHTGEEITLWEPPSKTSGEDAAPGVAAVSWHPKENKVIFIHGPFIEEVEKRGYYGIPNRTGTTVDGDGKGELIKLDKRDIAIDRVTTPGAHRGGTHRHEYSRDGKRVGFTYNDILLQEYDRTIGYLEAHANAPEGYTHYFALILKPAAKGTSGPGEIEKAYGDSWVNKNGTARAFIGIVRAEDGIHYDTSLFVAEIPEEVDITTAYSGDKDNFPEPPKGITIKRLTFDKQVEGIVRSPMAGDRIAYIKRDDSPIKQVFEVPYEFQKEIPSEGLTGTQVTRFDKDVSTFRWHPSGDWLFSISGGNLMATYTGKEHTYGKSIKLTNDHLERSQLVVSPDGNTLAYNMVITGDDGKEYYQLFIMNIDTSILISNL